jgi:ATP-binding cassette subfamily G (WHITE) protein 2 (SNQ2)
VLERYGVFSTCVAFLGFDVFFFVVSRPLLNVLAERAGSGIVTGERFFSGQVLPIDFQAQTGYCQQMDTHAPLTTVREALIFSARLRHQHQCLHRKKTPSKSQRFPIGVLAHIFFSAEKCLTMCGLNAFADAMLGSLGVEQRKRTTVGVELAAKASVQSCRDSTGS